MSAIRMQKRHIGINEDEPPEKKILSDGDILIKELFQKQTNTTITLKEQLSNRKEFQTSSEFVPITSCVSGAKNLKQFEEILADSNYTETLKASGLSNEDVQLFVDYTRDKELIFQKHKNYETSALLKRIADIKDLIENYEARQTKQQDHDEQPVEQRKHSAEFGLSVKPNSIETKLLKFALNSTKQKGECIPHPMDNIKQIEQDRFGSSSSLPLPISKIRKKARNLANKIKSIDNKLMLPVSFSKPETSLSLASSSKWDIKECINQQPKKEPKHYTCKAQNFYTIRNGEIVKINDNATSEIKQEEGKQMSLEELKSNSKFQDYQEGVPSRVLYLKNLHKKVSADEIGNLFEEFGKNHFTIKLLTGKMSGQAFVTFLDEKLAMQALKKKNGIVIKNRPVVIQFGKQK